MSRFIKLAAIAISVAAGTAAISAPAFAKACVGGICASSIGNGRSVNVYLSHNLKNVTHFNVRRNGTQVEVKPGQTYLINQKKGFKQYYNVQACNRGGFLQKSSCTGWVRFYHTS